MLPRYYEDPSVLRLGALPCRANFLPENAVRSLDGEWAFRYYDSVEDVPEDVAARPLEGAAPIKVPSAWQFSGYDRQQYTNVNYPFPFDPPYVPRENPCGVYRRAFHWDEPGRRCVLCFDGVDSCFYVWLNGAFAGYAQVPHTTTEFDVTPFVRQGENELTVAVLKWCDGSYLEDQDKFRMSGIFRSVYLLSRAPEHIRDLTVSAAPEGDIDLRAEFTGNALPISCALLSPDGERVAEAQTADGALHFHVDNPRLWTAETPALYTLVLRCAGETIRQRVGLRRIEVKDGVLLVNGSPVRFRGVNRHDASPYAGCAVTPEDVLFDMRLMKQNNINAIRTSHYPNAPYFYDMADEYGFYVIAEADIESHGACAIYGDHTLTDYSQFARMPEYHDAILDRVQRNVIQHKNCACAVIWSLGNESGNGKNFEDAARWIHEYDPTRPVHFESEYAHAEDFKPDLSLLNVKSSMYASVEQLDAYFEDPANTRPYVLCEYAHAMGLGPGDIEAYWQCFDRHPGLCGGFVWEWRDHALFGGYTADGREKRLYGGDFGEFPHDGNFCCDGMILPDGTPSRSLVECKNVYRPARVLGLSPDGKGVLLRSTMDFTDLSAYASLRWTLLRDGVAAESGECALPSIPPRGTGCVPLPLPEHPQGDLSLLLETVLVKGTPLETPGNVLGVDQLALSAEKAALPPQARGEIALEEDDWTATVSGEGFRYVYDKRLGAFAEMEYKGAALLAKPMAYNVWRAPTDNDVHLAEEWRKAGYDRALTRTYETTCALRDGLAVLRTKLSLAAISLQRILTIDAEWTVGADGCVNVRLAAEKCDRMPCLPRFGLRLFLPEAFDRAAYLGFGPDESYSDLRAACRRARFEQAAGEMAGRTVKPQECGARFGCDWAEVSDGAFAVRAESETPFSFSALPYTQEELTEKKHEFELEKSGMCVVCLDYKQIGVGSNACGPRLAKEHSFDEKEFVFEIRLTPYKK